MVALLKLGSASWEKISRASKGCDGSYAGVLGICKLLTVLDKYYMIIRSW